MKKHKAIIYSAGGMAEKVTYSLDSERYEIVAYIDINPEFHGKNYLGGKPIIFPNEISQYDFDIIINAISMYDDAVRSALNPYVDQTKIITFLPNTDDIIWADERFIMAKKCSAFIYDRRVSGNVAEVGVYKGEFSKVLNSVFPDKTLHLFDTFEGFVEMKDTLDSKEDNKRFKDTSVQEVLNIMPYKDRCIVHKGWFPDTAKEINDVFCFVSLDCDLYEPTKAGLEFFYPRVSKGGYIFVHDYGHNHYSGVKRAVDEFLDSNTEASVVPIVDRGSTVIFAK